MWAEIVLVSNVIILPFLPLASYPESQNFNNVQLSHMGSIEKDTITNGAWSLLYVHISVVLVWLSEF